MQFASMSLGIFDFLIEWLTKFLIWIVQFALELVGQLISLILYGICVDFLKIVDFIQKMFYKLCGLGSYWVNGVEMKETDPLISIITDKSVLQVLLALTLVAVAMVIVATIIQVLRTEFSTEGSKNTKGQVFGQAIKALVMFAIVPICCGGGILITNALLQAVNTATSLGAESSVGGAVYVASTYSANHIRNGGTIESITQSTNGNYVIKVKGFSSFMSITKEKEYECTISGEAVSYLGGASLSVDQNNRDEIAQKIDNAFRSGYISFDNKSVANTFYDVGNINFVTFLGGGLLAAYTMLMASFGMIMRMYKAAVLFVISPAMSGLMPLDNGKAFARWRESFIKQILSAYGTIVAMNLLFILLPIVGNITLFGGSTGGAINAFVQMLFTLTGLFMLKDMSGMIAGMIGADDAGAAGAGMAGKVLGTAAKIGSVAVGGVAGVAAKGLGAAAAGAGKLAGTKHAGAARAFNAIGTSFGGLGNKMTQRAKGTAGAALNKVSNVVTGGEFKPFDEEKDYDRAQKAKAEKIKAKQESGREGIGGLLGAGAGKVGDLISSKVNKGRQKQRDELAKYTKDRHDSVDEMLKNGKITQDTADNMHDTIDKNARKRFEKVTGKKVKDKDFDLNKALGGAYNSVVTGGASTIENTRNVIQESNAIHKGAATGMGKVAEDKEKLASVLESFASKIANAKNTGSIEGFKEAIAGLNDQAGDVKDIESLLRSLNAKMSVMDSLGSMSEKQAYLQTLNVKDLIGNSTDVAREQRSAAATITNSITNNITSPTGSKVDLSGDAIDKVYEKTIEAIQHKGVTLTQTEINSLKKTFGEETKKAIEEAQKKKSGK